MRGSECNLRGCAPYMRKSKSPCGARGSAERRKDRAIPTCPNQAWPTFRLGLVGEGIRQTSGAEFQAPFSAALHRRGNAGTQAAY